MEKRKVIAIVVASVLITNLLTLYFTGGLESIKDLTYSSMLNTEGVSLSGIEKYNFIKNEIKSSYVDDVSDNTLMEGAIRGLAEAVNDPYTEYLDKKEYEKLKTYTKANYAGIGSILTVNTKDNLITVSEIFENSPAGKAKLQDGDKIVKVNDIEVSGSEFDKAVEMIKGEKGTTVKLSVLREGNNKLLDFNVIRDIIEIKTVKTKDLNNDIGYIRIIQFAENTSTEFDTALTEMENKGKKKLIIDLRDNTGGLLDQVVNICGKLLPKELVVYTIDKQGNRKDYLSEGNGTDMPLVVLVNGESASASEILTGAIKDYKRGTIVGEKTYGKGVVQSIIEFKKDGSALKLTTSKYYTPNGISINKVGIQPDEEVKMDVNKSISKLTIDEDIQLQKAIEILNK